MYKLGFILAVLTFSFSIQATAKLDGDDVCSDDLYSSFRSYRLEINRSVRAQDSLQYVSWDFYLEGAKEGLKSKSIFGLFFISAEDVELEARENLERLNTVMRETVGVHKYFGICDGGSGELFLDVIDIDKSIGRISFSFSEKNNVWLMEGINLVNYSAILGEYSNEFNDKFKLNVEIFPPEKILNCLIDLNESGLKKLDQRGYELRVNECYERLNKSSLGEERYERNSG